MTVVFLDRDGTINHDDGYVASPERVRLIDGASKAIGDLKRAGHRLVIVSNQSAIGRGIATQDEVIKTNEELQRQLLEQDPDAKLDLVLFSDDHPDYAGVRRKPGIGMFQEVEAEWSMSAKNCWMVGDKTSDLYFGSNAGLPEHQCILVLTGYGEEEQKDLSASEKNSFRICADISEASLTILQSTA